MSGGKSLCGSCGRGRNCVNGRYCAVRRMYVEYENITKCDRYEKTEDNQRAGGTRGEEGGRAEAARGGGR